jgi:hypothetical protein
MHDFRSAREPGGIASPPARPIGQNQQQRPNALSRAPNPVFDRGRQRLRQAPEAESTDLSEIGLDSGGLGAEGGIDQATKLSAPSAH